MRMLLTDNGARRQGIRLNRQIAARQLEKLEREMQAALRNTRVSGIEISLGGATQLSPATVAALYEAVFRGRQARRQVSIVNCRGQALAYLRTCGLMDHRNSAADRTALTAEAS